MRIRVQKIVLPSLVWIALAATGVHSQQNCPPPPVAPIDSSESNLFSRQQEVELGEIIGQQVAQEGRVIEDDALTSRLTLVGGRLAKAVGTAPFPLRFFLYDQPIANAFSIPGGRIYVSRKIVALLRNDDELAGLLGHEIGHEFAGHPGFDLSRKFRQALGVTAFTDRADMGQEYFDLMEAVRRKSNAFQVSLKQEETEQRQADAIALYAAAAAGYDPQAMVNFWDRFSEAHGNTGTWLSDLFGATRPEARRLREMLKDQADRPAICAAPRTVVSDEEFRAWQASVIGYAGLGHQESVHGVLLRRTLTPPLPNTLNRIRFSPDGKYLLAQDEASIFVLSRQPFEFLFRIDAPSALPARFSPDSQSIAFNTKGLRVETWNVAARERSSVYEITLPERHRCLQSEVSDDGKYVACIGESFNLMVYAIEAGALVYEKKDFYRARNIATLANLLMGQLGLNSPFRFAAVHFSPDGKYLLAGTRDGNVEAVELEHYSNVPLPGEIKKLLGIDFTFLGADRLAGVNAEKPDDSAVVRFPSGEHLNRLLLGNQTIEGVTRGDYLLLTPVKDYAAGIVDIKANKVLTSSDNTALDIYDDTLAAETPAGMVGLYAVDGGKFLASALLPQGPLGPLKAFELSKDLSYLALSGSERGGVWDLKSNKRIYFVRGFHGGYFADDASLYVDFDKMNATERSIAKMDLQARQMAAIHPVAAQTNWQAGPYLVAIAPIEPGKISSDRYTIEVRDTRTNAVLWNRAIRGQVPLSNTNGDTGTMMLGWRLSDPEAKIEIMRDPKLAARYGSVNMQEANYFMEAINATTGQTEGGCIVDTGNGAFRIERVDGTADRAIVIDSKDRILVYSLSSCEILGRTFGRKPAISSATSLLAFESEPGKLSVLDLATLKKRDEFSFFSPIATAKFDASGGAAFCFDRRSDCVCAGRRRRGSRCGELS